MTTEPPAPFAPVPGYATRKEYLKAKWDRYQKRRVLRQKRDAGLTTWVKWFSECPHGFTIWDATTEPIETHPGWIEAFSDETECELRHNRGLTSETE